MSLRPRGNVSQDEELYASTTIMASTSSMSYWLLADDRVMKRAQPCPAEAKIYEEATANNITYETCLVRGWALHPSIVKFF